MNTELVKFNVLDSEIEGFKEFLTLEIKGINDKEGYNNVDKARKMCKAKRVEIEKQRKEFNEDAVKFTRFVNEKAKEVQSRIEPIETACEKKLAEIDEEKEAIRTAELKRIAKLKDDRKNELLALNMRFDGNVFAYNDIEITYESLEKLSDFEFEGKYITVKKRIDLEKEIQAEKEAKEKAEREEIARQQAELKSIAETQAKREAELKAEEKRIKDAQEEEQRKIAEAQVKIEQEKQQAIKAEQDRIKAIEQAEEIKKQAEIQAKIDLENKLKAEKEAEEKRIEEEKRLSELAPDKEKLTKLAESILSIPVPSCTSESAKIVLKRFTTMQIKMHDDIVEQISKL